jgi:hypothetical protein
MEGAAPVAQSQCMTGAGEEHWVKVPEAAKASGLGERTLYTRLAEGALVGQRMEGVTHVRLADCLRLAAERGGDAPEREASPPPPRRAAHAGQSDPEALAHARLLQRARLESELRAAEVERRAAAAAEREVAEREQERDQQRRLLRERAALQLEDERIRLKEEREARRAERERERLLEDGAMAARAAEARALAARRSWERRWLTQVSQWVDQELGAAHHSAALETAARTLARFAPEESGSLVWRAIQGELTCRFGEELERRAQSQRARRLRMAASEWVMAHSSGLSRQDVRALEALAKQLIATASEALDEPSLYRALAEEKDRLADEASAASRAERARRVGEEAAARRAAALEQAEREQRQAERAAAERLRREQRAAEERAWEEERAAAARLEEHRQVCLRHTRRMLEAVATPDELRAALAETQSLFARSSGPATASERDREHQLLVRGALERIETRRQRARWLEGCERAVEAAMTRLPLSVPPAAHAELREELGELYLSAGPSGALAFERAARELVERAALDSDSLRASARH